MPWPSKTAHGIDAGAVDAGSDRFSRNLIYRLALAVKQIIGARAARNGIASLDKHGRIPDAETGRGAANGIAGLDQNIKLKAAEIDKAAIGRGPTGPKGATGPRGAVGGAGPRGATGPDGPARYRNLGHPVNPGQGRTNGYFLEFKNGTLNWARQTVRQSSPPSRGDGGGRSNQG